MRLILLLLLIQVLAACQQDLPQPGAPHTGLELVQASARFHDPASLWPAFQAEVAVHTLPAGASSGWSSHLYFDRARDTFRRSQLRGGYELVQVVGPTGCSATWPHPTASEAEQRGLGLLDEPCTYIASRHRFFDFLVGLPMVALEGEPIFDEEVGEADVFGEPTFEVHVDFPNERNGNTWYLYVSRADYHLVAAKFVTPSGGGEMLHYPQLTDFGPFTLKAKQAWYHLDGETLIAVDEFGYGE